MSGSSRVAGSSAPQAAAEAHLQVHEIAVLLSADDIRQRVNELGREISADYAGSPDLVLVGVLRGSLCFFADLMRAVDLELRVDCLGLRSYDGRVAGEPVVTTDLVDSLEGADVILVEDIIERGSTLTAAFEALAGRGARSIAICALLRKDLPRAGVPEARYVGFDIGREFVVGYGLDYHQKFRNLPFVGVLPG